MNTETEAKARYARTRKISGASYAAIGKELKVSRQRVQQLIAVPKGQRKSHPSCEQCGIEAVTLHHHHINYRNNHHKVLCISCHRKLHRKFKKKLSAFPLKPHKAITAATKTHFAAIMSRDWNVRQACRKLKISRPTGYRIIDALKLKKPKTR